MCLKNSLFGYLGSHIRNQKTSPYMGLANENFVKPKF